MTDSQSIDDTINKAAFWSAVVLILAGVLSVFFPLDAPEGPFADRMQWYSSNIDAYVMVSADIGSYAESMGILLLIPSSVWPYTSGRR